MNVQEQLQDLIKRGLRFSDCVRAFGVGRDSDPYASKASEMYEKEGEVEIDSTTVLSDSDGGNYVLAWVWVSDDDVGKQ